MIDVEKLVTHWRNGALSSWEDALYLIKGKRVMLGMFAVHLALEKVIKAHVIKRTGSLLPKIHNLIRLAEIAKLDVDVEYRKVLAEINDFNIEGRYSDEVLSPISFKEAKVYMNRAKGTLEWLINLL
ncbi:MAG: HEPN domain-containing protein [Chloroflexi bacterium]|nr:HEPN domain-containing protein [Chloroflexota bacterium]